MPEISRIFSTFLAAWFLLPSVMGLLINTNSTQIFLFFNWNWSTYFLISRFAMHWKNNKTSIPNFEDTLTEFCSISWKNIQNSWKWRNNDFFFIFADCKYCLEIHELFNQRNLIWDPQSKVYLIFDLCGQYLDFLQSADSCYQSCDTNS